MNNQKEISVVTCSKNRHDYLEEIIESTKNIANLKEHIIVDFSSNESVDNKLSDINKKVKILKIENEKNWWLSRAYNFGMHQAKGDFIFKLDADSVLKIENFNKLNYEKYQYIGLRLDQTGLGNFIISNSLFKEINGFNEYIYHWGYDDLDILERIKKIENIRQTVIDGSKIIKLYTHSNELRFNIKSDHFKELSRAYSKTNSYIAAKTSWSNKQKLIYKQKEKNIFYIKHFYSHRDNGLIMSIRTKVIFLKVYLNERYKTNLFNKLSFVLSFVPISFLKLIIKKNFYPRKN